MIPIDDPKKEVYIKLTYNEYVLAIVGETDGHGGYKHITGDFIVLDKAVAGMGYEKTRIANLPPECLKKH